MTQQKYYYGTGRRKSAIARVRVFNTPGSVTVNGKPLEDFITVDGWKQHAIRPLLVTDMEGSLTVVIKTHGGGISGQAGAISLGISRAIINLDPNMRKVLKTAGLLTRDSRVKESKKYGLKRARKAPQYTKR
ncbi:MAG: 30S ribosomal protein S9 [Dehalococcoidia bacterium]|nr:30S ribosomal protein S9 [Dehalococcoidia bacterium]HJN58633.1 30S ribosomal protein S9 [Dehalococcoidia bacterium]